MVSKKGKKSATERAFEFIEQKIREGEWHIGEKIPSETVLVTQIGVSRSAIREVLQQFGALGIIKSHQGRGTFLVTDDLDRLKDMVVRRADPDSTPPIREILVFREIVEPSAVLLCMRQEEPMRGRILSKLEEKTEIMRTALASTEAFIRADIEFHATIAAGCGNSFILTAMRDLLSRTRPSQRKINSLFGFKEGLAFHEKILKAMRAGDEDGAVQAVREHMGCALAALEREEAEFSARRIDSRTGTEALRERAADEGYPLESELWKL